MARNPEILSRIRELSEGIAKAHDAFVVDLSLRGERHTQVLELFLDTDSGITADGCAAISRDLSARLDYENLIPGRYNLVVSSPGLDRPLKLPQQYNKNIGRNLKVRYQLAGGKQILIGRLAKVEEMKIVLQDKATKEEVAIPFDDIEEAKIEIEFGQGFK